jgi:hypothetical protein
MIVGKKQLAEDVAKVQRKLLHVAGKGVGKVQMQDDKLLQEDVADSKAKKGSKIRHADRDA